MFWSERNQGCVNRCPGGFVEAGVELLPKDAPGGLVGAGRRCADAPGEPGADVPLGPATQPKTAPQTQPVASKTGVVTLPTTQIVEPSPSSRVQPQRKVGAVVTEATGSGAQTASIGQQKLAGIPVTYIFGGLALVGLAAAFAIVREE